MAIALVPSGDDSRLATLGGRIKWARFLRDWDQGQLIAEMKAFAGQHQDLELEAVSRRTLSDWENNKRSPTVDNLLLLADTLGQPVEFFVAGLGANAQRPPSPSGPGSPAAVYPPWDSNPEPAD